MKVEKFARFFYQNLSSSSERPKKETKSMESKFKEDRRHRSVPNLLLNKDSAQNKLGLLPTTQPRVQGGFQERGHAGNHPEEI